MLVGSYFLLRLSPALPIPPATLGKPAGDPSTILLRSGKVACSFPQLWFSLPHLIAVLVKHDEKMRC